MLKNELTDGEFNMIESTLNSHYIFKMIKNHLEEYLFNPKDEINKFYKIIYYQLMKKI